MKLIDALENIRRKHRSRLEKWHADDGEWVTIKGTHVEIDDETGAITKGPERLKTMNKPERGLASAGKKALARTKERMKSIKTELEDKKSSYRHWESSKKYLEEEEERIKKRVKQYEKELEKQIRTVTENYPEGKEFYIEKSKKLEQEYQEMAEFVYGDEHKEERRAIGKDERERLYNELNEKLKELNQARDAVHSFDEIDNYKKNRKFIEERQEDWEWKMRMLMNDEAMVNYQEKLDEYDKLAEKRNLATLKVFPNADACKTSIDVSDYLRAKEYFKKKDEHAFDADTKVNLDSMDPENAKACARRLDQFMTDYPGLQGEFGGIDCHDMSNEEGNENAYAYCDNHGDKKVCYNEELFKTGGEAKKSWEQDVARKWTPPGTDPTALIDHEYTHAIEMLIKEKRGDTTNVANLVMERAMIAVDGEYNEDREQEVREALCTYAGRNRGVSRHGDTIVENQHYGRNTEFIAEAMAEARNSPNPRPYAVAVRKEMEKLMKEVGLL